MRLFGKPVIGQDAPFARLTLYKYRPGCVGQLAGFFQLILNCWKSWHRFNYTAERLSMRDLAQIGPNQRNGKINR